MRILSRYIVKTSVISIALTALMIAGIVFLLNLLGEVKGVGENDYNIIGAFIYVLMRMPAELYHFSPLILLLGSVIGLSVLSSYRELAVMRTSGYSIRDILKSVMFAALIILVMAGILGEIIAPKLNYMAEVQKNSARNGGQAVVTSSGLWLHIDNDFIHVHQVVGRELFEGVTRYDFNNKHQLQAAYYAKQLSNINNKWIMTDVQKTTFINNERTQSQFFPQMDWGLKFNANLLNIGLIDPDEMSMTKLYRFAKYLDKNGLQSTEYRYEFWQRIFQPLVSLTMVLLAVPFVLGVFKAATLGFRIMIAFMVGFAFFILNSLFGQLAVVYQIPAGLAAFLPLLLFVSIGIYLNKNLVENKT